MVTDEIPDNLPEIEYYYLDAIETAKAIKFKKMKDYDSHGVEREDYYLFGNSSLINEIWKKMLRLISLSMSKDEPECEKVEDTLLDMINYCADFYSYLRIKEQRKERK